MSSDSTVDRLGNLPKNVIDSILTRLPIKVVVRTSILSRRWRYEWNDISKLVFDSSYILMPKQQTEFDRKLVKIVDHVLLLHRGPVLSFKLSVCDLASFVDTDRWFLFLSRNGIKELTVDKWKGEMYKLHSCVFSCNDMNYLELYRCTLSLPDSFKGFANLTVLDLQCISSSNNALEVLISTCPLLQKLTLRQIDGCTRLKITALHLINLQVEGVFEELYFESTPLLTVASINLWKKVDQSVSSGTKCNLVEMLGMPSIEKLDLLGQTLQTLTVADDPMKLPIIPLLRYLTLDINFEDMQDILAVICCFRSTPMLQKLIIKAVSDQNLAGIHIAVFWEAQGDHNCLFSSLKFVNVAAFSGVNSEMKFVEFVLENAPVLETLQIELKKNVSDVLKILKEFHRFRRRSAKARIVFAD